MPESDLTSVIPAQLSFLTIYNPLLGPTDESISDQVVFYTSRADRLRRSESSGSKYEDQEDDSGQNERLRQIGLAQGIVSFARNFSEGKSVDHVETEKSTVILHELEENWWILASIDLTRLPTESASSQRDSSESSPFYYSSREICPPQLLIQQLRRAHSIFLLHHEFTLQRLHDRVRRSAFCTFLERFWSKFAWSWDILLSGNPAVDIYNGIKLAAGGELGIGVGEEDWGSGEREVLEDFVFRTDGLVDLVVSRFGDPCSSTEGLTAQSQPEISDDPNEGQRRWLGMDTFPRPQDGVIFSGVGGLSRSSLIPISQWMEWIFRFGYDAYGAGEDPTSPRRRKRRRKNRGRLASKDLSASVSGTSDSQVVSPERALPPGIPRPLVIGTSEVVRDSARATSQKSSDRSPARVDKGSDWKGFGSDTFVKYLTLGYGSSWSFSSGNASSHPRVEALKRAEASSKTGNEQETFESTHEGSDEDAMKSGASPKPKDHNNGRFIIGLRDESDDAKSSFLECKDQENPNMKEKVITRMVYVRRAGDSGGPGGLRLVVYINRPFIYTFLFDPQAPLMEDPSLYLGIHHQLGPLQKSLSKSTSPSTAAERISMSGNGLEVNKHFSAKSLPVYDLVYDPTNLTIRSSIPNIPDLGYYSPETDPWPRVESLNIHHRLLSTYAETRSRPLELERTCKTGRGWWIVWVRIAEPQPSCDQNAHNPGNTRNGCLPSLPREAFLIRKASDHVSSSGHARGNSGARFFRDLGGASSPGLQASRSELGAGKLVEGLGLDARRYIENLLSLNR
ncbi:uncharacterized protein ACLA_088690 [Aspergillus clavatus NRRL 1]|uniref:CCZ1/INTU/HSP4 first Longin domain-containing protein n=1 Tax=Aspergillus clavatus (strain ATCC 1007 / CBS 513.65 / DSM 816 / NCTC 3887 / NRRL 1 / QM 1276 / 107) TaxID=344612 RepID=A1CE81_ASPCL|nr:uncharacterized protein ACLA_088690 [Aspergillus clavatus NRRL 1]EAW11180.1 conserved hypothetical protein [Aspergillus clavatus NRRL 1]